MSNKLVLKDEKKQLRLDMEKVVEELRDIESDSKPISRKLLWKIEMMYLLAKNLTRRDW